MTTFIERPATKASLVRRKLILGVATNDAPYMTQDRTGTKVLRCPYYVTWLHMIKRCYCPKHQADRPTYIGCTVSADWLLFSNFKAWMVQQDWQGNTLDKDLLLIGNKVYCAKYCVFISKELNNVIKLPQTKQNGLPLGVWLSTGYATKTRYTTHISRGKLPTICKSNFLTPDDAHIFYKQEKRKHLLYLATTQQDKRVKAGLLNWANYYR